MDAVYKAIQAILLGNHRILIDPVSTKIGGAWQGKDASGTPRAWDPDGLNFFYERICELEKPFILDIGANTGLHCLLATINPLLRGFAFEPNPEAYRLLKTNLKLNKIEDRIDTMLIALSNRTGTANLKIPASGMESGLACLGTPKRFEQWREVEVPTDTLDRIAARKGIHRVDLIKIDTEGCELMVLQGAQNLICANYPGIVAEFDERNTAQFGYHPSEIVSLLRSWGYDYLQIGKSDAYFYKKGTLRFFYPSAGEDMPPTSIQREAAPLSSASGAPGTLQGEGLRRKLTQIYASLQAARPLEDAFQVFFYEGATAINFARLLHLDSLSLPLEGKSVLEVGSGIGLLTHLFEAKGCDVVATEYRPENVSENLRLFPYRQGRVFQRDLSLPGSHDDIGARDIVFCYGTLYHLHNPEEVIRDLARVTREMLLLETCVWPEDNNSINSCHENQLDKNQAGHSIGCRPARNWVLAELKKYFPYVYVTATQPDHQDFPLTWPPQPTKFLKRSVFVASRKPLDSPFLLKELPSRQQAFHLQPVGSVPTAPHDQDQAGHVPQNNKPDDDEAAYRHWIDILAYQEKRLYYRDQTPDSLAALGSLARDFAPTVIVELGTLGGLSLRAWTRAAPEASVKAVDLSFATLQESLSILPLDLSRVTLLEQNILTVDFSSLWGPDDRVLFFVDAHDLPGVPIMDHVLGTALPTLPMGSLVVVDDLWHAPQELTPETAETFFREKVQEEIDWLQCFEGHYAPYHGGGSFLGFREVVPLMRYVNERGIPLRIDAKSKNASFVVTSAVSRPDFDQMDFTSRCGVVSHNPLEGRLGGNRRVTETMTRIAALYRKVGLEAAMTLLIDLAGKEPSAAGLAYALAVCQARLGHPRQAIELLNRELARPDPHPQAAKLLNDLTRTFLPLAVDNRTRRPGLTLFAMPKAFVGHAAVIQRNAIESWTRLTPRPDIILFGDEEGIAETAATLGVRHEPQVGRNELGTPLVNALFGAAQELAATDVLAYVNADILLFDDFPAAVDALRGRLDEFLMIGRRFDFDQFDPIDFARPDWTERLVQEVRREGILHAETGIDYFVFTPGLWPRIPPFAIGRTAWDNWLVRAPHELGKAVVDATDAVTAVHQNHDYGHQPGGKAYVTTGIEARRNKLLCGPIDDRGFTNGSTWGLDAHFSLAERAARPSTFGSPAYKKKRLAWLLHRAGRLLAAGLVKQAEAKIEEGLDFAPQNEELLALRERFR